MKALFIDVKNFGGHCLDMAYRARNAGHSVKYWTAEDPQIGEGLVPKIEKLEPAMDWADLIVVSGNVDYPAALNRGFANGYPIVGANPRSAVLELDRGKGQEALKKAGIEIIPYIVVDSIDDAIDHLLKTDTPCVIKPWGGTSDKALTHVCKSVEDGLFTLERWKKLGLGKKDKLMLQEKVDGVEVGIAGWFGPNGWCQMVEESFEHKKFLTGDLGQNTGEMGTVLKHLRRMNSALFREILEPLTETLLALRYVGNVSVNCMVVKSRPLPMEWTMRFGWPSTCLTIAALAGADPIEWLGELQRGHDAFDPSEDVVVGVCTPHGDFPMEKDSSEKWGGFPFYSITTRMLQHLHFQQMQWGPSPALEDGKMVQVEGFQTAGQYPLVVTGLGDSVRRAKAAAYGVVEKLELPSNLMYRTDIGDRLKEDLPELQEWGFCTEWEY